MATDRLKFHTAFINLVFSQTMVGNTKMSIQIKLNTYVGKAV